MQTSIEFRMMSTSVDVDVDVDVDVGMNGELDLICKSYSKVDLHRSEST